MRIDTFLAQVAAEVGKHGFITSAEAKRTEGCDSTGTQAFWAVEEKNTFFTEEDETQAAEALAYIREMKITADTPKFLRNLQDACRLDTIGADDVNLVAVLIETHQNAIAEAEFADAGANSEHIGTVNLPLHKRCTIIQKRSFPNRYGGMSHIIKFHDDEGNQLVWWASKMPAFEVGTEVRLIGKVKKHDMYNGVLETYVTRCKLSLAPSAA